MKKNWTAYGDWQDDKRKKEREEIRTLGVFFGNFSWDKKYEGKELTEFKSVRSAFSRSYAHETAPYPSGEDGGYASFSYDVRNDITSFTTSECEKELLNNPEVDFIRMGGTYFFHRDDISKYERDYKVEFVSYCLGLVDKAKAEKREMIWDNDWFDFDKERLLSHQLELSERSPFEQRAYYNEEGNLVTVKLFSVYDIENYLEELCEKASEDYYEKVESGELEGPPDNRVVIKERTHLNKTYQVIAEPEHFEGLGYRDGYVGIRYVDGEKTFSGVEEFFGTGMGWDKVKELESKGNSWLFKD
jgi:hypothetical protein